MPNRPLGTPRNDVNLRQMALKMLVKVGEITNLSDARYCAGMGVDMLGFNLNPDADTYVSPECFKEITGWISGVRLVGEFGNASHQVINKVISDYKLDMVQMSDTNLISTLVLPIILQVNSLEKLLSGTHVEGVQYYLLDDFVDIESLKTLSGHQPILIGNDINAGNIISFLENTTIKGIALKGSIEEKPGFKDYDQLADILEVLETDD